MEQVALGLVVYQGIPGGSQLVLRFKGFDFSGLQQIRVVVRLFKKKKGGVKNYLLPITMLRSVKERLRFRLFHALWIQAAGAQATRLPLASDVFLGSGD